MKNKRSIYLMYAITLLQGMVFYAPVATLYRRAQGVNLFEIAVIECISTLLMLALEIPWGYVADRIGYKKTLVICNMLYMLSKVVFWKAADFGGFLAERLMLSVVCSGLSGCDTAYLFTLAGEEDSHRVFGIYQAMCNVGIISAAVVFSATIGDNYSLAGFATVVTYSAAMVLTLLLREVEPTRRRSSADFFSNIRGIVAQVTADKRFFLFLIAAALMNETCNYLVTFVNQLQYLRTGVPTRYMGYLYIAVSLSALTAGYSQRVTAFLGERKLFSLLLGVVGCACVVLMLTTSPVLSVLCFMALRGSVSLFMPAALKVQNSRIKTSDRATLLSIYACVMDVGAVFSNLTLGKTADISVPGVMGVGALFCLTGFCIYNYYRRKE